MFGSQEDQRITEENRRRFEPRSNDETEARVSGDAAALRVIDGQRIRIAALEEALVRAHDTMLMLNSSDLGRSDREALYAAREHAKRVLGL